MSDFWTVTVPDWLVGVGTLALAGFAFSDLRRNRADRIALQNQLLERERLDAEAAAKREAKAAYEARRAQAEQVVVWKDYIIISDASIYFDPGETDRDGEAGIVLNDSPLPITNVWVQWCEPRGTGVVTSRPLATVPPRSTRTWFRPTEIKSNPTLVLELEFTDAHGVIWKRTRDGKVTEVPGQ